MSKVLTQKDGGHYFYFTGPLIVQTWCDDNEREWITVKTLHGTSHSFPMHRPKGDDAYEDSMINAEWLNAWASTPATEDYLA